MAHFAKIDENNVVLEVIVVPDEQEHRGQEYLNEIGIDGRWIQSSYNNNIRGRFAGPGMIYNEELDVFRPNQPFPSWTWEEDLGNWKAPTAEPEFDQSLEILEWNEESLSWSIVKKNNLA